MWFWRMDGVCTLGLPVWGVRRGMVKVVVWWKVLWLEVFWEMNRGSWMLLIALGRAATLFIYLREMSSMIGRVAAPNI